MNNLIETQYNTHFKRASLHKCGIETGCASVFEMQ